MISLVVDEDDNGKFRLERVKVIINTLEAIITLVTYTLRNKNNMNQCFFCLLSRYIKISIHIHAIS